MERMSDYDYWKTTRFEPRLEPGYRECFYCECATKDFELLSTQQSSTKRPYCDDCALAIANLILQNKFANNTDPQIDQALDVVEMYAMRHRDRVYTKKDGAQ